MVCEGRLRLVRLNAELLAGWTNAAFTREGGVSDGLVQYTERFAPDALPHWRHVT